MDRWNREGVVAHRGVAVADMPNLFFLLGPNTGLGHTSVVFMIESQIRYVAQAIAAVDRSARRRWRPTRGAQDRYNDELQEELATRCGTPAVAVAGTWTSTASTGRCGAGMTWEYWLATCASSSRPSTSSSGSASKRRLLRGDNPRHANTRCCVADGCPTPGVVSVSGYRTAIGEPKILVKWGSSGRHETDRPRLGDQLEPRCRTRRTPRCGTG